MAVKKIPKINQPVLFPFKLHIAEALAAAPVANRKNLK